MTNIVFRVVPQEDRTYHVELVRPDGGLRRVTGFQSEHEARAWGVQAERMMVAADRRLATSQREGRHRPR